MLLGFISLLLTVGTRFIYKICIPAEYGNTMLPCKTENDKDGDDDDRRRKLLLYAGDVMWRRVLAAPACGDDYCSKKVNLIIIINKPINNQERQYSFISIIIII